MPSRFIASSDRGSRRKSTERAYCLELDARGITFECEKSIDVRYKTWVIPGQRVDLVVEGVVLVEIKAVRKFLKLHERQVRSYLKTMDLRAALMVNLNTTMLKNGLQRIVAT